MLGRAPSGLGDALGACSVAPLSEAPSSRTLAFRLGGIFGISTDLAAGMADSEAAAKGSALQDLSAHFLADGLSPEDAYLATACLHHCAMVDEDFVRNHPDFDDFVAWCSAGPRAYSRSAHSFCCYFELHYFALAPDYESDVSDYDCEVDDELADSAVAVSSSTTFALLPRSGTAAVALEEDPWCRHCQLSKCMGKTMFCSSRRP